MNQSILSLILPKKAPKSSDKTPWRLPIKTIPLIPTMVLASASASALDNSSTFPNSAGLSGLFSTQVSVDANNEFFQALGSNGRSCNHCHRAEEGWSITPQGVQKRFADSAGTDPVFRPNDGANSPKDKLATLKDRRNAYSLLLKKALFRIALKIPKNAEFTLIGFSDPYGNASLGASELSVFRRPLPATNLKFLSAVMWDGRETMAGKSIRFDLGNQANSATTGHAQGVSLSRLQRQHIVDFETSLYTAQVQDKEAGLLTETGIKGGPKGLSKQRFYLGINDFSGDSKTAAPFNPAVFNLFNPWNNLINSKPLDVRAAIARGQKIFNTKPLTISAVPGLNDSPDFGNSEVVIGTCSTCHNTPNVGSHSGSRFLSIGSSDEVRRTGDLPLYTLRRNTTGEILKTSDPGRALITGRWNDIGRFKVPSLRGLAARAPYFHNGMAGELGNVLDFYDSRFHIGFDNRERMDLILFLRTL